MKGYIMIYAVLLCAVASLSTAVGGIIVILYPNVSAKSLCFSQGFAAGVMVGISFGEMLPNCYGGLVKKMSGARAMLVLLAFVTIGWIISVIIGRLAAYSCKDEQTNSLKRVCLITTAIIILHNLPEGMLTSVSALGEISFGLHVALAVALHNIPEGIAVASSGLYLTNSKFKAFMHSFGAGLAELVGGVTSLFILHRFITAELLQATLAIISGIMLQVSVCELVPAGAQLHSSKCVFTGLFCGVVVISLGMFII